MTKNQEPCQNKITLARLYRNTSWSFLSRIFQTEGEEKWDEKCVRFVYTTIALWMCCLGLKWGRDSTHARTHKFSRWLKSNWHSNRANTAAKLSICAHRLDWFEKVALKVTSKRQDQNSMIRHEKKKKRSQNKSFGSRKFHASEMLLAFDSLIDLWRCGGQIRWRIINYHLYSVGWELCWVFFFKGELPNVWLDWLVAFVIVLIRGIPKTSIGKFKWD